MTADRHEQMFPVMDARDIERIGRFGRRARYGVGDSLFVTGQTGIGLILLLSGRVRITQHDGAGHSAEVVEHFAGQFLGEVSGLSGRPALVDGVATEAVDALVLDPAALRALIAAEADLGERIMRALILRRTSLIETAAGGPVIIADARDPGRARIANFLRRNGMPLRAADPAEDAALADIARPYAGDAAGDGLAATMSRYLIDRIEANPNIELMTGTEITQLEGDARGLEAIRWRRRDGRADTRAPIRNVFLFVGAQPATSWLDGCGVDLDDKGFVATDTHLRASKPGIFAIGDARSGSVKRVGGAIGEGAAVVAEIHRHLLTAAI